MILPALTGIRGVAAWFVVLYHIRSGMAEWLPEPAMAVLAKGYLAVDLFFMLSGFVLWLNHADRLRDRGLAAAPAFWWQRLARIWPLHAVLLASAVAFALLLVGAGRADPVAWPFAELPLHLSLTQNWGFTDRLSWNHPAWSISAECAAYLLFPLLAAAVDWRRIHTPLILLVIALLTVTLFLVIGPLLGAEVPRFGLVRCIIEFTIGTALCGLWVRHGDDRRLRPATAAVALLALLSWTLGMPETLAAPLLFAAGLLLVAAVPSPLGRPVVLWLGEISYATYLVHFLWWIGFKLLFVTDAANVAPPLIALFLVSTLALSALLYRFVEKPAQRWLNAHPPVLRPAPSPRQTSG